MTENVKSSNGVKAFLLKTLADPILIYVTIVMMSVMYHYRSQLALMYGILTYVIGWVVFRIFDFINKHNVIGFFAYIILFLGFMKATAYFITEGYHDYPITFGLWFLTPQDSLLYNKLYTAAIFTLFLIFMLSVIYYFTRVRYRIFMNFLIFIIPFAIYGKEYEEMPIGYIIALAVGYVLIMALFRQLSDSDKAAVIDKPMAWKSAAVFTVLFALISALIPKPTVEADRRALETLINADALTDRLVAMLSVFRDSTDGEQFRAASNGSVLYYAEASEPLHLKNASYTYYDYNSDSWKASDLDSRFHKCYDYPSYFDNSSVITAAVHKAAQLDGEFAAKYGLTELADMELSIPADRKIRIHSTYQSGNTFPVPQNAKVVEDSDFNGVYGISNSGVLYASDKAFSFDTQFTYEYTPDTFFTSDTNKKAVELISRVDDYCEMLDDADDVILGEMYYDEDCDLEYEDLLYFYSNALESSCNDYGNYLNSLLDYDNNQQIWKLAKEITAGAESDYDKARLLEWYFINNDYTYDLTYRKEKGDNAVDFLFKTKTGVCYEYATAMTLLARASGIPARYCEGFNMQNADPDQPYIYRIKGSDAHGFPELYIKGYGWMTFEPTMSDNPILENKREASSLLAKAGIILLVLSILALILILLSPAIANKLFIIINSRRTPNAAVSRVMRRICRIYGITSVCTAHQAEDIVRQTSGADISGTAVLFERAQYGGETLTEADKSKAMEQYSTAYTALREAKKQARKKKKKPKTESL